MLLNYLKLATRLLIRNPFFTSINLLGLSVGFAVFYILSQHSSYELKSDQFHKDHERIFRIYFDLFHNTGVEWGHLVSGCTPPVFTSMVKEKYTEIETATRIIHQNNFDQVRWAGPQPDTAGWSELNPKMVFSVITGKGEKNSFIEEETVYADPNLFEFFSIPLLSGSPHSVLSGADNIVISVATARKYFGDADPVNKIMTLDDSSSFTVTGVFQDLPSNSHLTFKIVLSTVRIQHATENVAPFMRSSQNYLKVRKGISLGELEKKLNQEQKIHWDFTGSFPGSVLTFFLKPLKDVPFQVFDNDVFTPKSKYIAGAFQLVAIVVLVMAWINYLNLKLSMQAGRMKELGARKTAGASRNDFIKQFLMESLFINGIAVLIAFTLVQLTADLLQTWFHFYLPDWNEITASTAIAFLVMMTAGIMIAGFLPAISVWRMTTRKILGYKKLTDGGAGLFVQATTVVQFVSAIALIVWLFSVSKQVDFVTSDTWGLDRNRVIVVEMPAEIREQSSSNVDYLKNELLSSAGVDDVALSTTVAGDLVDNPIGFNRTDTTAVWVVSKSDGGVDERFIPFYGLELLAGRNFLPDHPSDKRSVIISRQTARNVGLNPETAIGKIVWVGKYPWTVHGTEAKIIGVIEEHRYNPLYLESGINNANRGTILTYGDFLFPKNKPLKLSIRISRQNIGQTIETIEKHFMRIFPDHLFHWYFLEHHMNIHYQGENIARNQILLFTCIAIGIACLGLLGMVSNKVVQKTKEIGIRKVLGAGLYQIANILLKTTVKQTVLATIIGIPVSVFLTEQYLQKFSERITLQWWQFIVPAGILIVILFITISSVLWKATRTNPVDSLRYE
jgi:putative ABC transport system permease protein